MLRILLDSDKADVRIAAYQILTSENLSGQSDAQDVETHPIGDRFYLDLVRSDGAPMIYATTTGMPRIALFGINLKLRTPITFAAMDYRFSISSSDGTDLLTLFYRDPQRPAPLNISSHNSLDEIIAHLGGMGSDPGDTMNLGYGDVVAILQELVARDNVSATNLRGEPLACMFQLEHPQLQSDSWISIPRDTLSGRPQGSAAPIAPTTAPSENIRAVK
jgi:hypothetical protein